MKTITIESLIDRENKLKISASGIRGIINEGLDLCNSFFFFLAFSKMTKKKIVIARDTRPNSETLSNLLISILLSQGKRVLDLGVAPTPNIKFAIKTQEYDAGVMITASHNDITWNGMKFFRKNGLYFKSSDWDEWRSVLNSIVQQPNFPLQTKEKGDYSKIEKIKEHVNSVLELLPSSGLKRIQSESFKVLIDTVGGTSYKLVKALLDELNCQTVSIYHEMQDNNFPRTPEPNPANLTRFTSELKNNDYAVGFALDPDGDRLVLGSSKDGAVDEEFTLPLSLCGLFRIYNENSKLKKFRRTVVVNRSTSTLIEQMGHSMDFKVIYVPVGEANVVQKMQQAKAVLGGEGNGGVICPIVPSFGRDPLVGMLLILYYMAYSRVRSVQNVLSLLPPLYMHKTKIDLDPDVNIKQIYSKLIQYFRKAQKDTSDGLYLSFSTQNWIHIRPSNTESQIRLIAQGTSDEEVREQLTQTKTVILSLKN